MTWHRRSTRTETTATWERVRTTRVGRPLVAALTVVAAAACSDGGGDGQLDRDLLALSEVCVPVPDVTTEYAVSPGSLILEDGERATRMGVRVVAGPGSLPVFVALDGVQAGDALARTSDMVLVPGDEVDLAGPGQWPIVLAPTVEPGAPASTLRIAGVEVRLDGDDLVTDDPFDLRISPDC